MLPFDTVEQAMNWIIDHAAYSCSVYIWHYNYIMTGHAPGSEYQTLMPWRVKDGWRFE